MCYDHNLQMVSHGWNTAIGVAADLQLAAAIPVARYVEYLTPAPYIEDIVLDPPRLDAEGFLTIPDRPGLGVELNREALRRFSGPVVERATAARPAIATLAAVRECPSRGRSHARRSLVTRDEGG